MRKKADDDVNGRRNSTQCRQDAVNGETCRNCSTMLLEDAKGQERKMEDQLTSSNESAERGGYFYVSGGSMFSQGSR